MLHHKCCFDWKAWGKKIRFIHLCTKKIWKPRGTINIWNLGEIRVVIWSVPLKIIALVHGNFFLSGKTVFQPLDLLEYCQEKKLKHSASKAPHKHMAATSAWKVGI